MSEHDSFDQWLQDSMQANTPYLDDDGFSQNVLAQLPAKPKLSQAQQTLIVTLSCLLGCFMAGMMIPTEWLQTLASVETIPWSSALVLGGGLLLLGAAIVWNDREQWI